ncbi:MAG: hypothetical protein ACP5I3_00815 [Thermoproteus sp.]
MQVGERPIIKLGYSESLIEFFQYLDPIYRQVINIRLKITTGKDFIELVSEKPRDIFDALSSALGRHNAEVFLYLFTKWLTEINKDKLNKNEY